MSSSIESILADAFLAPAESGTNEVAFVATTTTAAVVSTVAHLTNAETPDSKAYISLQADGGDVYVRFSATNAANVNANTGILISDGAAPQSFLVNPRVRKYLEYKAKASTPVLKFWWSSPAANGPGPFTGT